MIPSNVKVGQRWSLNMGRIGYVTTQRYRVEEIISITSDRESAQVVVKHCTASDDTGTGREFKESFFDPSVWSLLEGQETPNV